MPYVDPGVDDDKLAWLLTGAKPPMAQPQVPPGVNPALLQPPPQMVPAAALAKPAMSTGVPMLPNSPPPAPVVNAPAPASPDLGDPLKAASNAIIAQKPTAPTPQDNPYTAQLQKDQANRQMLDMDPSAKPKWWERLLAFGVGTAAGWKNPEAGYEAAEGIANRRYNNQAGILDRRIAQDTEEANRTQQANQQAFEQKRQSFEDALKGVAEQRQE